MAQIDIKTTAGLITQIKRNIQAGFVKPASSENWGTLLVQDETLTQDEGTYLWYPQVTELEKKNTFYDPTTFKTPKAEKLSYGMEFYSGGIQIPLRESSLDPKSKWYENARNVGVMTQNHTTKLVSALVRAGTTTTIWDGQNWFDNAHPKGGTTFDNLLAGDLSTTTIVTAKVAMSRFPNDMGDNCLFKPDTIVVAGENEYLAKSIVRNTSNPNDNKNTENQLKGIFKNIVVAGAFPSTESTDWYVFNTSMPEGDKPIIHLISSLNRIPNPMISDNSQEWFKVGWNKMFAFSVEYSHAISVLDPRLAIKMVGS